MIGRHLLVAPIDWKLWWLLELIVEIYLYRHLLVAPIDWKLTITGPRIRSGFVGSPSTGGAY